MKLVAQLRIIGMGRGQGWEAHSFRSQLGESLHNAVRCGAFFCGVACAATHFPAAKNEEKRWCGNEMPNATEDERVSAAVAKGHTGKLMLGGFATLAVAATGTIWLLILLVRIVL